ncbi:MAG TPA: hypothetical protein PLZ32_07725 [Saprospiraceae bacterium]|nr:hypothetical protein [Saprospiraceae bacterium]
MNSKFIFIIIILVGLSIWCLMLIVTWDGSKANELLTELGKTGANLSLITAIGGLVQWILKEREAANQKEKETLNFYRNVLADFKSVYDKVEKARLLIQAHRTARTYGEQMQELIQGVVILHNIKRALNPGFPNLKAELIPYINKMSYFIKDLLTEYRDNYLQISILQEIDEKQREKFIQEKLIDQNKEVMVSDIPSSSWKQIENLAKLSAIKDEKFNEYQANFLVPLDEASSILRKKIPVEERN